MQFWVKFKHLIKIYKLTLIKCAKIITMGSVMIPIAFCALSVGILFGCYNIAASRNPDEAESIYSSSMTSFVLIETFAFLGLAVCAVVAVAF